MALERTLSIIKPDAVARHYIGEIYQRFTRNELYIVAAKMSLLTRQQAQDFYGEHRERDFFEELVEYMTSGPVMISVLEGENAIARHRLLIGATMPENAAPGTIRYELARGASKGAENAVHGSENAEAAQREIDFFFQAGEIYDRI